MQLRLVLILLFLVLGSGVRPSAHEVPNEVTVLAFLKPEGQTLRFLVRAPMESLRDISIPIKGDGYLDISRADGALRDAATLWISDFVELYESGVSLPKPTVRAVKAELPSSRAFASYDEAVANVTGPRLPDETNMLWEQGVLDVLF